MSITREDIIAKYSATPEGRARLAVATFGPAEVTMEVVANDPTLVEKAERIAYQMEEIQALMQGDEDYDRRRFGSLLEGLKMLSGEIRGRTVFKKL
jgi:hypothetical protein